MDSEATRRALLFDEVAELYDRSRPAYPEQIFDDLFRLGDLQRSSAVLEIGCGTGQASRALARRGGPLVCVEPGERLARIARRNLTRLPQVEVITAPFETWEPRGAVFDMVFAATAWHWLDPSAKYRKAARILKPGGVLAFVTGGHAFPEDFDPFFTEIQECYNAIGKGYNRWPPPRPEDAPDDREAIERSGLFEILAINRYVWAVDYSAQQYVDLLNTYSDHRAMQPSQREALFAEIMRRMDARPGGRVHKHYLSILHVARLLSG